MRIRTPACSPSTRAQIPQQLCCSLRRDANPGEHQGPAVAPAAALGSTPRVLGESNWVLSSSQREEIIPWQAFSLPRNWSRSSVIPSVPRIAILPHQEIMDFLEHYCDLFHFHYAFSRLLPLHSFSKQISELHKVFPVNNTHLAWTKENEKEKTLLLLAPACNRPSSLTSIYSTWEP